MRGERKPIFIGGLGVDAAVGVGVGLDVVVGAFGAGLGVGAEVGVGAFVGVGAGAPLQLASRLSKRIATKPVMNHFFETIFILLSDYAFPIFETGLRSKAGYFSAYLKNCTTLPHFCQVGVGSIPQIYSSEPFILQK